MNRLNGHVNSGDKPGTFQYIDMKIRAGTTKELGDDFEYLCKFYLENSPRYRGKFQNVWLWNDWPDRWGPDTGIDLVAETTDGKLWAIQAKGVNPQRAIPKRELDSFLSESNRRDFAFRLVMATTNDIGLNARRTIAGQQIPVGFVLRGDLVDDELTWPKRLGGEPEQRPKKSPRPDQRDAIKSVVDGFKNENRGKLILACGTGKTLTSLWIHERLKSKRTLFLVPSLSLVNQTLLEWGANAKDDFDRLVVCSDETVTHSGKDDSPIISTTDLGIEVTTDARKIGDFLKQKRKRPAIVFCTYQSADRIIQAQANSAPAFGLAIADEAHRCTGHVDSNFTAVLDGKKIKSKKRLFMTATPRYFTDRVIKKATELDFEMASMDDEKKFGRVFHELTFGEAIKKKLLSDYQVVIISADEQERKLADEATLVRTSDAVSDARTLASQIGLAKAIRKHDLHKIITFHSTVAKAKRFADPDIADSLPSVIRRLRPRSRPTGEIWTGHISGQTPAGKRKTLLTNFANLPNSTRAILTNCACLGEGVDVPALDGVAFIDPKRSMVDIIQAVGRVIRKTPEGTIGTIIIPVFIDETLPDPDAVLSGSAFKPVWQVLKALRAHDKTLADELDGIRLKLGKRSAYGGKVRLPSAIKIDIPTLVLDDFEQAFKVKTVETTTRHQWRPFKEARAYARALNLKSQKEWLEWSKTTQRPFDIPSSPSSFYKTEWTNWGDWLGTRVVANQNKSWRPFKEARAYVQKLGLQNSGDWLDWSKNKRLRVLLFILVAVLVVAYVKTPQLSLLYSDPDDVKKIADRAIQSRKPELCSKLLRDFLHIDLTGYRHKIARKQCFFRVAWGLRDPEICNLLVKENHVRVCKSSYNTELRSTKE